MFCRSSRSDRKSRCRGEPQANSFRFDSGRHRRRSNLVAWRGREKRRIDAEQAAIAARRAEEARLREELVEQLRRNELLPGDKRIQPLLAEWGDRATACAADSDCAVSCKVDGRCCEELCSCENVYALGFVSALEAQRERECKDATCITASCVEPCFVMLAACVANRCTGVRKRRPGCQLPEPKPVSSCGCLPGDPLCSCL